MLPVYPDLQGRAAIVTGASSGIGLGIAQALLAQGMRVAVHYRGVREAAEALRVSGHGSIVLIGSTAGQRGEQGHSHYAASKGALQSLALSLAVELAPRIRTNVVSPGWIRTPMAETALRTIGPLVASTLPNRRLGEIEDVVNAVLYLSSDASSHLLGENLSVSGGALLVVPRGQLQPR